jgi:nucleoside-diphosphate-sugar epimerase
LVGNTGLVGTTLKETINFDLEFNSKNINTFLEKIKDGSDLYLSCLPATKWLVNKNLQNDIKNINNIIEILSKKKYNKIILISTIDIYNDSPLKSNEDYIPNISGLSYGNNRYFFEVLVRGMLQTNDLKIFRLPALFNKHIKKNILYDLINNNDNQININSSFQWYNLNKLSSDIIKYSSKYKNEIIFNLFTEPIETSEIVNLFPNLKNKIIQTENKIIYDYTTKYNNYISSRNDVLNEIKYFINEISIK